MIYSFDIKYSKTKSLLELYTDAENNSIFELWGRGLDSNKVTSLQESVLYGTSAVWHYWHGYTLTQISTVTTATLIEKHKRLSSNLSRINSSVAKENLLMQVAGYHSSVSLLTVTVVVLILFYKRLSHVL